MSFSVALSDDAAQPERDVARDVEPRERRVFLEHDADAVRRLACDRRAFELDGALRGRRETGDQFEQRRLAAAGGTDDGEEFALPDVEVDRADRMQGRRRAPRHEGLADVR